MIAFSGISIIVSIVVLAVLTFKKISPLLAAPIATSLLILLSGLPFIETLTKTYIPGATSFVTSYLLIFVLSAILGKIYDVTGAARSVGETFIKIFGTKGTILALMIAGLVLVYGGVSAFVAVFAIVPIAHVMFKKANIPNKYMPGVVVAGTCTVGLWGPGSPQINNLLSMSYLGTGSMAGLVPGAITGIIVFGLGFFYLRRATLRANRQGLGYVTPPDLVNFIDNPSDVNMPNFVFSVIPLLVVLITFNALKLNIIIALLIGDLIGILLLYKHFPSIREIPQIINAGALSAVPVLMNTAMIIGFGYVSKLTPFYSWMVETVSNSDMSPYILTFVATNLFAGFLGSSSGGLGLALGSLSEVYKRFAEMGYSLELIHRIGAVASGGLDAMPYSGAVISFMAICGVDMKDGYFPIFVVAVVLPVVIGIVVLLPLCMMLT